MVEGFLQRIARDLPEGSRLLLAVSGGKDSVALLHTARLLQTERRLDLFLSHVNHNFRAGSSGDADFVKALGERFSLPTRVAELDGLPVGANLESWGREQRYRALEQHRAAVGADWILTAHTQNDVIETFFMQALFSRRMYGIASRDDRKKILRPFLEVTRAEIDAFVADHCFDWIEDESNEDQSRLRNQIRHTTLPFLREQHGEHIDASIAEIARTLHDEASGLSQLLKGILAPLNDHHPETRGWYRLSRELLLTLPVQLQPLGLEEMLLPFVGYRIGRHRFSVHEFWFGTAPRLQLPGGWELYRSVGGIRILNESRESRK